MGSSASTWKAKSFKFASGFRALQFCRLHRIEVLTLLIKTHITICRRTRQQPYEILVLGLPHIIGVFCSMIACSEILLGQNRRWISLLRFFGQIIDHFSIQTKIFWYLAPLIRTEKVKKADWSLEHMKLLSALTSFLLAQ